MHLNKKIISEFYDDVEKMLLSSVDGVLSRKRVGVLIDFCMGNPYFWVILDSDNGYTKEDSLDKADKIFNNVKNRQDSFSKKWNSKFDLVIDKSYSSFGGEGEYSTDYTSSVFLCFRIGSYFKCSSADDYVDYIDSMNSLCSLLCKYNCNGNIIIADDCNGISCSIGKYFKYRYSDGALKPTSFISPDKNVLLGISRAVSKVFSSLSKFGVSIDSVKVRNYRFMGNYYGAYFFDIGNGDCKLWSDVCVKS